MAYSILDRHIVLVVYQSKVLSRHWKESGETQTANAAWSRAGKSAEARNAFKEALESCQQALALLKTLPESPKRDLGEWELWGIVGRSRWVTCGFSATESIEAIDRIAVLAEKTNNLVQLFSGVAGKWVYTNNAGDFAAADALADQAFELALREGSSASLSIAHGILLITRDRQGDLAGVEQHFTAWLKFSEGPGIPRNPGSLAPFALAAINAW